MPAILAALLLTLLFALPETARGDKVEDIFMDACAYTVKIRAETSVPFKEDVKGTANGAGFVVDKKRGWIMTNAHVAGYSPSKVSVSFQTQDYKKARRVYVDPYIDVAIVELPANEIPAEAKNARLDCGELPAVGHPVGAYGHPWGLSYTGTRGIVSGSSISNGTEDLQTDAPMNVGNSGGPLISLRTGRVVAINTASLKKEDDQNTNFAVPMKHACRILELLRAGKDPSPPDLRAVFMDFTENEEKLVIARTFSTRGSIDLRKGDVIEAVEGVPDGNVGDEGDLVHLLRGRLESVRLSIVRGGQAMTVSGSIPPVAWVTERGGVYCSGVLFADSGYRDAEDLGATILVHYVERGSPGEAAKIDEFDLLVSVGGKAVKSVNGLYRRLSEAHKQEKRVTVILKRPSDLRDRNFTYLERELPVEDLKWVGK